MLTHLSIHNFAIVEKLDLELSRGMTVVSGETGAGKSIMIDALQLALGGRADSGAVRSGAKKTEIIANFDISQLPQAQAWLEECRSQMIAPVESGEISDEDRERLRALGYLE